MDMKTSFIFICSYIACSSANLLLNADFEEPFTNNDWRASAATITQYSEDAYMGQYSCKVSNAQEEWSSVGQFVDLQPNTFYEFSMMVKLLNQSDPVLGESALLRFNYVNENGTKKYQTKGELKNLRVEQGWQNVSGDFLTPNNLTEVRAYMELDPWVEYLVDTASLTLITPDPDWRQTAEDNIEQLRKNDITINLSLAEEYNPDLVEIRVNQLTHDFAFGSCVKNDALIGTELDDLKYQQCYYDHFNWAVLGNALKYEQMERNQGEINYPDEAIMTLNERGIPLRGHCVFWDKEDRVPEWLKGMGPDEIKTEMTRRYDYLIPRYNESLVHWDINNEQEHGKWYENNTQDVYVMDWMFREVHARGTQTPLFLNDYHIVSSGVSTQGYVNTARAMISRGVPVHAMGIQSHISGLPNMEEILHRLDKASQAGLPIWITELDVENKDRDERAEGYDDLVTAYFGHPAVYGIIIWGFHDEHHWKPDAALFEGPDYIPNAAGLRWQEMLGQRWRTFGTFTVSQSEETFTMRGFYGTYNIQVFYDGTYIQTDSFQMETGSSANVYIYVK